jgi:hypothetical protein
MRTKKPCVRARRVLEGWYVRFIFDVPDGRPSKTIWLFLEETGDYRKLSRGWQTLGHALLEKNQVSLEIFWFMMPPTHLFWMWINS